MDNLILLFGCLFTGLLLQRSKAFPPDTYRALNAFVIYISLPAVALYYIPDIRFTRELLFPVGVAWIAFAGSFLLFGGLGRLLGWPPKLTGCLILTAGLGNTSFVGFPVIEALYGTGGIRTAILVDQPGTFVVMSTLGITVAALYARGKPDPAAVAKKILLFPPFIAFAAACVMNVAGWHFHADLASAFQKIAVTVTPLALVSVGLQLKLERRSRHWRFLGWGLLYKLVLTPALIFVLYVWILGGGGPVVQVSVMEAAMAPMITAAVIASSNGLKPRLGSMMIGFGIPLSFLTLCIWYLLVRGI